MNGDKPLWTMRRAQTWPETVWIVDGDAVRARDWHMQKHCLTGFFHAEIELSRTDVPEAADFRCCIGLTCQVTALRGESRARRLHQALIDAKAIRVVTAIHQPSGIELLTFGV